MVKKENVRVFTESLPRIFPKAIFTRVVHNGFPNLFLLILNFPKIVRKLPENFRKERSFKNFAKAIFLSIYCSSIFFGEF